MSNACFTMACAMPRRVCADHSCVPPPSKTRYVHPAPATTLSHALIRLSLSFLFISLPYTVARWAVQCERSFTFKLVSVVTRLVPSSGASPFISYLGLVFTHPQGGRFRGTRHPGRWLLQGYHRHPARAHQRLLQRGRGGQVCSSSRPR